MTNTAYPFATREILNYVDGAFVATGAHFDNVNPVTGEVAARVSLADQPLVDRAVAAARRALKGPWGKMSQAERCKLLVRVAEGIEARFDEFAAAEIADTGKSLHQARTIDIPRGAANFRAFAGLAEARAMPSLPHRPSRRAQRDQLRDRAAAGRGRDHFAVEPAAAADDLEGRPGARLRQYRGGEAQRGNAIDCDAAGRGDERRRRAAGRVQRRPRLWRRTRPANC